MLDYSKLPSEDYTDRTTEVGPSVDSDLNLGQAIGKAVEATFPFYQTLQFPIETQEITAGDEEIQSFYQEEFPTLSKVEQDSIQGNGGFRNRQQVDAVLNRVRADQETQEELYNYGGLTGSILLQAGASITNPIDLTITVGTLGAGKALTTLNTVRKVTNNYKKTSAVTLGAIEGATAGYLSETIRQETQSIEDEDARFNTFLFGSVLGGSIGASGWFKELNNMNPQSQQSLLNAIDTDTQAFDNQINEATQNLNNQSIGSAGFTGARQNVDIDDITDTPTQAVTGAASKFFSPRAWLYSTQLPSIYKTVSKLAPSMDSLKDASGNYVLQNKESAFDIKAKYEGKKSNLVNSFTAIYNDFNLDRQNQGLPKLNEIEFNKYMYDARMDYTMQTRERQAEIDVLNNIKNRTPEQEVELNNLVNEEFIPTHKDAFTQRLNESFDDYYKYMEDELRRPKVEKELQQLRQQLDEVENGDTVAIQTKISELEGWQPKEYKSYLTRIFDKDRIEADVNTIQVLTRALQNSPTARAMSKYLTREDFNKEMNKLQDVAAKMAAKIEDSKDLNQLRDLLGGDGAGGKGIVSGGFATGRRIDVDERLLDDLVHKDMGEVLDFYHTDMAGKLSIRKAFKDDNIDSYEQFKEKYLGTFSEEAKVAGKSKQEIDRTLASLETVFKDIRGTQSIMTRPNSFGQNAKKILTSFNNIKFGPNFPVVALNELGPTLHMGGIKSLTFFNRAIKAAVGKIRNKEMADEFINELQGMGIGADIQNSKAMLRYTEGNHFFENNKVVNALRKAENAVFRYGGLIGMTDAMKSMLAGGFTARMMNISKRLASGGRLSPTERSMMSRLGMNDADILRIAEQFNNHSEFDGDIVKRFNIDAWDEDISEMWSRTLHRVTKGNILEPTAMDVPMLISDPDKPINALLFQYYKFPLAAQSSLLSKALNDKDAGALGAMMISSTTTALVEYGKVMAIAKLAELSGIEYDNPYDDIMKDDEQQVALAGKAFSMNPYFGVVPTAYNIAAPALQLPIPGSTYVPQNTFGAVAGATFGNANMMLEAIANPDKLPYAIYQQVPHIPFAYDLGKSFIKDEL